jgi:hypothetical protein
VLAAASLAISTQTAAADNSAWQVDLTKSDTASSNISTAGGAVRLGAGQARAASAGLDQRLGIAEYDVHTLAEPANTFAATVLSDVPAGTELAVDVRGINQDGTSTEWTEVRPDAPAVLPVSVSTVAVRVVLDAPSHGASPVLRALTLRTSTSKAQVSAGAAALTAGRSYRVYATREGLVGGTTANGHTIVSRDHFVALPSRRGLSSNSSGSFSVRVCASNGRCEWAPVWDVGPWNTNDDYWNPAGTRERFGDLPQGTPEAQAAYLNGYNGGHDQFGRTVSNPAGIDLADGTFLDGLQLADNSYVTVTYEWTGTPAGRLRAYQRRHAQRAQRHQHVELDRRARRELGAGEGRMPAVGPVGHRHAGHVEPLVPRRLRQVDRPRVRLRGIGRDRLLRCCESRLRCVHRSEGGFRNTTGHRR